MSEPTGPIEKILAALTDIGDIVKSQELTIETLQATITKLKADVDKITAQFIETKEYYRGRLATEDKRVESLQATVTELREQLRDEKVSVALLQMDCHGCVDEEYAAYFNLVLKEKT